jgi:hypothetical protein
LQEGGQQDVAQPQLKRQCKQQQQPQDVDVEPPDADVAAAVAAAEAGTEGHDAALFDVLSMLATIGKDANIPASQAMAGDILQLPETLLSAGRVASAVCSSGAGSGGGGGGSGGMQSGGQGARGRRRTGGLSRASSGGASGGPDPLEGAAVGDGGGGSSVGVQSGAKRLRRSSGAAKAAAGSGAAAGDTGRPGGSGDGAAMLPPVRKAAGVGVAGSAAQAGGIGSSCGARRAGVHSAPTDVSFEPSQQVSQLALRWAGCMDWQLACNSTKTCLGSAQLPASPLLCLFFPPYTCCVLMPRPPALSVVSSRLQHSKSV